MKDNANSEEGLSDRLRCSGVPLELARTRATLPLTDPGSLPSSRDGQAGKTLTWNKAAETGREALPV